MSVLAVSALSMCAFVLEVSILMGWRCSYQCSVCAFVYKFSILERCGARSVYMGAFVLKVDIVEG